MNKQTITFTASEQTLTKTGGIEHYASNIVSYIEASFTLGDNWAGYDSIRAVWESGYARIATVLDANNKCIVPAEVLTYKSKVNVNLVGSIVENTVLTDRLTTYPILALTVDADARVDSSETTPVTASQFEQFVDVVRDEASAIQNYTYDSEAWAVGQRAGVDVPSTDETYQNNAKYYADQGATLQQEVTDLKSDRNNYDHYVLGISDLIANATYTNDYYINDEGTPTSYENCRYTSLIPVDVATYILYYLDGSQNNVIRVHGYDSNGNWSALLLKQQTSENKIFSLSFDVPTGIAYVRLSYFITKTPLALVKEASLEKKVEALDKFNSVIVPDINVFDKTLTANIHVGYFRSSSTGNLVSNGDFTEIHLPVEENTKYICTGTSYKTSYYNSSDVKIGTSSDSDGSANYVFTTPSGCRYVSLNIRHATYPVATYMVVKGETLPQKYIPYGDALLVDELKTTNNNSVASVVDSVADEYGGRYYVGATREYTTFTSCIRALANDDTQKTIYIDAGVYDLYDEIGGDDFADTITNTLWSNWNDIIPPNTKIIGIGNVVFKFDVTSNNTWATDKLSPINILYSAHIENINIVCSNCRYAIHDDGSSRSECNYTKHIYKNVIATKTGEGYPQVFGGGIGKGSTFEFDGCIFNGKQALTFHNYTGAYYGMITVKNCVFNGTDSSIKTIRLSSSAVATSTDFIIANVFNTYIANNTALLSMESGYTGVTNPYKLTISKCGNVTVDTSGYTAEQLQYDPIVYQ